MRIMIVQDTDWLKRNPAQQHHLAERLSLKDHEIRVVDYEILWREQQSRQLYSKRRTFFNVSKICNNTGVTVIRPGIVKLPLLDYVSLLFSEGREIKQQMKEFLPDVVLGFGILGPYLAMKAVRKAKIPFIYYRIDVDHKLIPFRLIQPVGKMLERKILKEADKVLVINDKLGDYAIRLGSSKEKLYILRAGIDIKQFIPSIEATSVREKYGINEYNNVLFFMGWLYNFSGLKEVALQLAKNENSKLKFLIVGEGDAYEELLKIREKYNLQNKMILTGKKPYQEIPELISAADICLLPAYTDEKIMQDIVPIKLYEYMAMAKPVISTNLPGVRKEFGEDNGVIYVERPEDVIPKAIELIENNKLAELGQKARRFVEQNSWDKITDEFEALLEGAIEEKRKKRKESAANV